MNRATMDCPAYQTERVEQMRDQRDKNNFADLLLRAMLIVWPAIFVVEVHLSSLLLLLLPFYLLIFLLLFLCFVRVVFQLCGRPRARLDMLFGKRRGGLFNTR